MSALIRDAVDAAYGTAHSLEGDLERMRMAFGSWKEHEPDGSTWVEQVRSGRRLRENG